MWFKIMLVLIIVAVVWLIGGLVYLETGFGKRIYHDKMGWHLPTEEKKYDGCSYISVCKYCGKRIMQDSQGNWF